MYFGLGILTGFVSCFLKSFLWGVCLFGGLGRFLLNLFIILKSFFTFAGLALCQSRPTVSDDLG